MLSPSIIKISLALAAQMRDQMTNTQDNDAGANVSEPASDLEFEPSPPLMPDSTRKRKYSLRNQPAPKRPADFTHYPTEPHQEAPRYGNKAFTAQQLYAEWEELRRTETTTKVPVPDLTNLQALKTFVRVNYTNFNHLVRRMSNPFFVLNHVSPAIWVAWQQDSLRRARLKILPELLHQHVELKAWLTEIQDAKATKAGGAIAADPTQWEHVRRNSQGHGSLLTETSPEPSESCFR